MRGFIGRSGRVFSDEQRKAMFANVGENSLSGMLIKISNPDLFMNKKRFVLPAVAGASLAPAMAAIPAAGVGASAVGAGFVVPGLAATGATPIVGSGLMGRFGSAFQKGVEKESSQIVGNAIHGQRVRATNAITAPVTKPLEFVGYELGNVSRTATAATAPGFKAVGSIVGSGISGLSGFGEPYVTPEFNHVPTVSELILEGKETGKDPWGLPTLSKKSSYDGDSAWSIDVDKMREVVKKQYPGADVDADIEMLPSDKYLKVALEENPGREREASMSNGFYSPINDKAYLEAGDKLNTTRALLHECVHDMSDEGVEDYMLNEGYADYVAMNLMEQELGIPKSKVMKTLGYPEEVKRVEKLVDNYGRENVDRAFLKYKTLDYLKSLNCRSGDCSFKP